MARVDRPEAVPLGEQRVEEGIVLHPGQAIERVDAMRDQAFDHDRSSAAPRCLRRGCRHGAAPRVGSRADFPLAQTLRFPRSRVKALAGGRAGVRNPLMHPRRRDVTVVLPAQAKRGRRSMSVILGSGEHRYRVVENWANLPDGWSFKDVAAVGVDSKDQVYVFNRGEHPMMVFDRAGNFLRSWGEGVFHRAHGLDIDKNDVLYLTDDGDHTVRRCSTAGKVELTIGVPGKPAPFMSGEPFHRCTHTALSPAGEIYVSDGYGNARVHKFSPAGKLIKSWGESGSEPGQFNIAHNIASDDDGWVYVADRENHRVQVFDGNGKYETQWNNLHRPCGLYCCRGKSPTFVIGELGPGMPVNLKAPNLGPRLSIVDAKGALISRLGGTEGPGLEPGKFMAPHGLALDARGDIYVGEVSYTNWKTSFPDRAMPDTIRSLQKLEKLK